MTDDSPHDWFEADGFEVTTGEYGTVELYIVGSDIVEEDVWVRGNYDGYRWSFAIEGDCGEDGYRSFSGILTQAKDETEPLLSIAEMIEPDEYEDLTIHSVEPLFE